MAQHPSSVPRSGLAWRSPSSRRKSWTVPSFNPTYTNRLPSGASASPGRAVRPSASSGGKRRLRRATRGAGPGLEPDHNTTRRRAANTPERLANATVKRLHAVGILTPVISRDGVGGMNPGLVNASANCAAVANRSAGTLASALCTAASTCGGTVWRVLAIAIGSSDSTFATIACSVFPVCGGSPVSDS